ncbi:hypothetical protein CEXT_321871 [Caerostris extrusa]|uniref:Uncharacterized protein n=1 Tax=Caerostris extrusa TaxID=172846 RepID=A0AAV4V2M1_CAEEX|nr:hypothetical protein CEXT_321871 [Caerostris extrusa]
MEGKIAKYFENTVDGGYLNLPTMTNFSGKQRDSNSGLAEDMHTSGNVFIHGTLTNEEIDNCAVEESNRETRSVPQEASPETIF